MGKSKTSKPDFVPFFAVFTFLSSISGKTDYNKLDVLMIDKTTIGILKALK